MKIKSFFDPATFFLILGLVIGGFYCVLIPYGAGFDEEQHVVWIYDISGNHLLPNRNPPSYNSTITLKEFFDLSYQRQLVQTPASYMFSPEVFSQKLSQLEENTIYGFETRSIYSPVTFAPQVILVKLLWRKFNFPILPTMILMRMSGLMVYIGACYLAIRLCPFGKWGLAILALAPMAMFQASTLNADGFTNGMSFLFIGLVLFAYGMTSLPLQPKWVWAIITCSILLGFAKPGSIVLLPLLFILRKEHFGSKKWLMILIVGVVIAILVHVGWLFLSIPNSHFAAGGSQSVSGSLATILSNPGDFLATFWKDLASSILPYYKDWIAAYGYWVGTVPASVYVFFTVLLIAAGLLERPAEKLDRRVRLFLAGLFLFSVAVIMGMFFVANYVPGATGILGRQGRYFIPFAPLLFIALSGLVLVPEVWKRVLQLVFAGSFLLTIGYYSLGLYATYYTDCGYATFTGKTCSLPVYLNLDKSGGRKIELTSGITINQTFIKKCTGLRTVYVLIKSVPEADAGVVRFSLFDDSRILLASRDIPVAEIRTGTYLSLPLDVSVDGKEESYEIQLEAEGMEPSQVIGVGADRSDFYAGDLFVDGEQYRGDLIIRYLCPAP
jgi:uncharacterized membrane protein